MWVSGLQYEASHLNFQNNTAGIQTQSSDHLTGDRKTRLAVLSPLVKFGFRKLLCMGSIVEIYMCIFKLWQRENREVYSWNMKYFRWRNITENNYLRNSSLCSLISLCHAHAKLRIHKSVWQSMVCSTSWASCKEDLLIQCIICWKHDIWRHYYNPLSFSDSPGYSLVPEGRREGVCQDWRCWRSCRVSVLRPPRWPCFWFHYIYMFTLSSIVTISDRNHFVIICY